jgi:2-aminoadipate transaminase
MHPEKWLSDTAKGTRASDIRELLKLTARPDMISFAGGLPDPLLFPVAEYQQAMDKVMSTYGRQALQYSTTEGLPQLREALVAQLAGEGVECPDGIENIILTTGSQQALELLGKIFINKGDTVLIEAPSYLGAIQAFSLREPHYAPVEMDGQGLDVDLLAEKVAELKREGRHPKFLYTVPTFQNPAGVSLSIERRKALVELAEREDFLIIEDDPYGRLRFRGENLPPLKSLDRSGRVLSLRTFSKTLAPGLRTGYVVGHPEFLRRLAILKQSADLCSPALTQYIIQEMLQNGSMERYILEVIKSYGHKETVMAEALRKHQAATGAKWNEPEGGMFFWLQLPKGLDASTLLFQALEVGVAYVKGSAFYTDAEGGRDCVRLSFSQPTVSQIERGVERLASIIQAARQVGAVKL